MSTHHHITEGQTGAADREHVFELSLYPVDMSSFLTLSQSTLDATGVAYQVSPAGYDPTLIAQYALAHWNQYLATNNEEHRNVFLTQAYWLVEHAERIGEAASGWPISFHHPDVHMRGPWLSASAQGSGISVLMRAYQLTHQEAFRELISRVVRTFEQDILDGGVSAPVGADGIFFEDVAVYPATHVLSGFIFALFGLYDYVALTDDVQIEKLISRSLVTMHSIIDEFEVGFWTYANLLHRRLASPSHLSLQTVLLEALAKYSGCNHCLALASRWKGYQCRFGSRLRYLITSHCASYGRTLLGQVRMLFFPKPRVSPPLRVCIPVNALFETGGILTVLLGIARVTTDIWEIEFLTRSVDWDQDGFVIHQFGSEIMSPWRFPTIWVYVWGGFRKLTSLMHHSAGYHIILPQDGVFSSAFSGIAAKLTGARVVCIDHANLTLIGNRNYRDQRLSALKKRKWPIHFLGRLLLPFYWHSLYLLAWISARCVDYYLIPGVAGDGVEEMCQRLGVFTSRITRFNSMIEIDRHILLDAASRACVREKKGIDANTIVVAMACRLAPEKGLGVAVESISQALSALSPDLRTCLRLIIAGDGTVRQEVEEDIQQRGLSQTCLLWGDISHEEVLSLLSISDIFLSTTTRGTCFPMAILEAMASGCAVIASKEPIGNAHLLGEGRGIVVEAGDAVQTGEALTRLVNDLELCRQMGQSARDYIAMHHSPTSFRRILMRLTDWSELYKLLDVEKKIETNAESGSGQ